jgi:hypothetical protein
MTIDATQVISALRVGKSAVGRIVGAAFEDEREDAAMGSVRSANGGRPVGFPVFDRLHGLACRRREG